jgi:hypothetical protein
MKITALILMVLLFLFPTFTLGAEVGRFQILVTEIVMPGVTKAGADMFSERKLLRLDTSTGEVWEFSYRVKEIEGKPYIQGEWSPITSTIIPALPKGVK